MTKTPMPLPWLLLSMFACGYLLSTLLRGVTAALAPYFTQEFSVTPAQLGLLAGSYFFGFALLQLPIGILLDRYGVRLVLVWSLLVAALSCLLFALASSYHGLFWSRFLCGIGVSAAYIAPLTAARLWASHALQQRINAWLLMTGSLGLVLGTLPAESLASYFGWRSVFLILSGSFALLSISIAVIAPPHKTAAAKIPKPATISKFLLLNSYLPIVKSPIIWRVGVLVVINYAILVALQTLWVGPWLTNLSGETSPRGVYWSSLYQFLDLGCFSDHGLFVAKFDVLTTRFRETIEVRHPAQYCCFGVDCLFGRRCQLVSLCRLLCHSVADLGDPSADWATFSARRSREGHCFYQSSAVCRRFCLAK